MIPISAAAQKEIQKLFNSPEEKKSYFRIAVVGGGCSGFSYEFLKEDSIEEGDRIFTYNEDLGFCRGIVVDEISLEYLSQAQLDYQRNLQGQAFILHNPKAQRMCGCGRSISFD